MTDTAGGKRILVVDDSEEIREILSVILTKTGYDVDLARDGAEALEHAHARRPDLIVTDLMMPRMTGFELISHLRSDFAPPLPPVIVCSGFGVTRAEALERGASIYLPKPLDPDELIGMMEGLLRGRTENEDRVRQAWKHAADSRKKAEVRAAALLAKADGGLPVVRERLGRVLGWITGYFGFGCAQFVCAGPNGGELLAADRAPTASTVSMAEVGIALLQDILETGASLLLPNTETFRSFANLAMLEGIRCFMGVPVVMQTGEVVAALGLTDAAPHALEVEDLLIFQYLGRSASDWFQMVSGGAPEPPQRFLASTRLLSAPAFEALLDIELRIARGLGEAVELAVVEVSPPVDVPRIEEAIGRAVAPTRLGIGVLDPTRFGIFERAAADRAADAVCAAVDALRGAATLRGVGVLALVEARAMLLTTEEVVRIASNAARSASGEVTRLVVGREAWGAKPTRPA